ncbi:MAG: ATP-binding protein [Chloroflexaceae bacterium]
MSNFPLPETTLYALAPEALASYRTERYLGDDISVSITTFAPPDQAVIRRVYNLLGELRHLVEQYQDNPGAIFPALQQFSTQTDWKEQVRRIRSLQINADAPGAASANLDKVTHDIRGGALQTLSLQLQFVELGLVESRDVLQTFYLVRDHMKIMRNALPDLDPELYARDQGTRLHNVELLTEKWQYASLRGEDQQPVQVQVLTSFAGSVSERCLEFSALDRVLYNLMNNALRNTADGQVSLAILVLPTAHPDNLRFVVANRVSPEQQQTLQARYKGHLSDLFQGGFTTGGTGLGMRICADFVRNAYGLTNIDQGISSGYLGARLLNNYFVAWFHWPIAGE